MKKYRSHKRFNQGMTLIEILLVVTLVSMISIALYNGLTTGIRVWERSRVSVKEQDILIFFDKLTRDLHNSYFFSTINFQGTEFGLAFPTMVLMPGHGDSKDEYIEQPGKAEYYYDLIDSGIYRRDYNYPQALSLMPTPATLLVQDIDQLRFRYVYLTGDGAMYDSDYLDSIPLGIEVEVRFSDSHGQRSLKKYIDIPIGG